VSLSSFYGHKNKNIQEQQAKDNRDQRGCNTPIYVQNKTTQMNTSDNITTLNKGTKC